MSARIIVPGLLAFAFCGGCGDLSSLAGDGASTLRHGEHRHGQDDAAADDNGTGVEPGDDNGTGVEPGDDNGVDATAEDTGNDDTGFDDAGGATEPADDGGHHGGRH